MPSVDPAAGSLYTSQAYNTSTDDPTSLDKNGFLKMLTAQMANQDPTSGQDPNQYFQTISQMTEVEQYADGRFDIEVVGRQRMRLHDLETSGPYPVGLVDILEEPDTPEAEAEAERTLATFEAYRQRVGELSGGLVLSGGLPRDPTYLSWSLATACLLTLPERQSLLEAPDTATRLVLLRRSLVNELRAMKAIPSLPATEVARTRWNPN